MLDSMRGAYKPRGIHLNDKDKTMGTSTTSLDAHRPVRGALAVGCDAF